MNLTIASWNIEKNGQLSDPTKQQKVSDFVDFCCKELNATVVFLCEVHSARINDYDCFLKAVYGEYYNVYTVVGGYSNGYVMLIRKEARIMTSQDTLKYLNRGVLLLQANDLFLVLAHFKSGQTGLTKDQIENAAGFLQSVGQSSGKWAITGDMNWDYKKANELKLPIGAHGTTCWLDQTQAKGGILDWCLAGSATTVTPSDGEALFSPEVKDMSGPDHRPVVFSINW